MKNIIALLIIAVTFTGCDETKKVIDVAGNVQLSGKYTVTSIGGETVTASTPTMNFSALENTIRGNTGCNSFFGSYTLDLYALSFSDIGSTEMVCSDPIMEVENKMLVALRNTGSYDLENSMLTLYSSTDRAVLLIARKERNDAN